MDGKQEIVSQYSNVYFKYNSLTNIHYQINLQLRGIMLGFVTLILFIISSCNVLRVIKSPQISEKILFFFGVFISIVVIGGYTLSLINHIGEIRYWAIIGVLFSIISYLIIVKFKKTDQKVFQNLRFSKIIERIQSAYVWIKNELLSTNKFVFTLLLTVVILGVINLLVILFSAPNNYDSMAVHLARMAYYIQNNNLNYYPANHWAQVTHPKIQSILLIFTYLVSNRHENLTQLVQFISYWISIVCIYAIAMRCGKSKTQSLFAALISGLFIEWLMEATTTQSDIIVTALIGLSVYALLSFKKFREPRYLVFASLGISISLGTKEAAIIPVITLGIIAIYAIVDSNIKLMVKNLIQMLLIMLVGLILFTLPSGYLEVQKLFDNSIISSFLFVGESFRFIIVNGIKNIIRFAFDSFSFDGIPTITFINTFQFYLRLPFQLFVKNILGLQLETPIASALPFSYNRYPIAHEDYSWFGVFGFGFVWISVFISAFFTKKNPEGKILAFSSITFLLLQAFFGPYDPFRGRYFCSWAIFSAPLVSIFLQSKKFWNHIYVSVLVLIGCLSAIFGVLYKGDKPIISIDPKIPPLFLQDRTTQLTANFAVMAEPLEKFDEIVPKNATVAVYLNPDSFEYPLFGSKLTRTILPINSVRDGLQPIPENANYLLYTSVGYPCPHDEDIFLGWNWYLRALTTDNRICEKQ